jgi:hypothetical protein
MLANEYGRHGYRRVTAKLQQAGWHVVKDRVQRIKRLRHLQSTGYPCPCKSNGSRYGLCPRASFVCGHEIKIGKIISMLVMQS